MFKMLEPCNLCLGIVQFNSYLRLCGKHTAVLAKKGIFNAESNTNKRIAGVREDDVVKRYPPQALQLL